MFFLPCLALLSSAIRFPLSRHSLSTVSFSCSISSSLSLSRPLSLTNCCSMTSTIARSPPPPLEASSSSDLSRVTSSASEAFLDSRSLAPPACSRRPCTSALRDRDSRSAAANLFLTSASASLAFPRLWSRSSTLALVLSASSLALLASRSRASLSALISSTPDAASPAAAARASASASPLAAASCSPWTLLSSFILAWKLSWSSAIRREWLLDCNSISSLSWSASHLFASAKLDSEATSVLLPPPPASDSDSLRRASVSLLALRSSCRSRSALASSASLTRLAHSASARFRPLTCAASRLTSACFSARPDLRSFSTFCLSCALCFSRATVLLVSCFSSRSPARDLAAVPSVLDSASRNAAI
mmetsp:Transcript_7551/g.25953  ORF Transcript_7551/g.25953 Transcript_7551/m.25953 type:complete len:362 (+) Transcript_7551:3066-4151(+)